jgi:hypothetical protein
LSRGFSYNERIGWVCRILFEAKRDEPLREPRFGGLHLPWKSMPLKSWPLYPVACSGSSYFILSEGYQSGGRPEPARDYMEYCRKAGKFRKEPVAMPKRSDAQKDLQKLRDSKEWKAIKWTDSGQGFSYMFSEDDIWTFIKAQADQTPK